MESYILLIFVPIVFALLFAAGNGKRYIKSVSALFFIISAYLSIKLALNGTTSLTISGSKFHIVEGIMLAVEIFIILFLFYASIKHKRKGTIILTIIQTLLTLYTALFLNKPVMGSLNIDKLSIVMALIVNIVGTLIIMFSNDYIDEYEEHRDMKSKQKLFYILICLFISAMNGLIFSDNLSWVYFFWEITTIISFILISYNGDKEAYNSGFRALFLNLIGGISFSLGIILFSKISGVYTLSQIITTQPKSLIPVVFLCIAGFSKSAQFPFQSWLLGAMVAPTPVSALLHSSTMVKAGVYLIVKLASAYEGTSVGLMIAVYGGFSFLICSIIAISQRNAKRVLAYSTIANLGLIISSAGMGTSIAISSAIMLIIFHSVSKALLFLCTGQIEHIIGSRDIEEMAGLIDRAPFITLLTALGMLSMIIPPFGVLITKWIAIEAAANNPIISIFLVLGSACTTVYYVKWLGTILAHPIQEIKVKYRLRPSSYIPITLLGILIVGSSTMITKIFKIFVTPEIIELLSSKNQLIIDGTKVYSDRGSFNEAIVFIAIAATIILFVLVKNIISKPSIKKVYMCGENTSSSNEDLKFRNGFCENEKSIVGNLYLTDSINEKLITKIGYIVSTAMIFMTVLGGLV